MGSCNIYLEVPIDDTNPTSPRTRSETARNDAENSKSFGAQNGVSWRQEARWWLWAGGTATGGVGKLCRSFVRCDDGRQCVSDGLGPLAARRERQRERERERENERETRVRVRENEREIE
ncbi:hypothetical protein PanWU01x14_120000 [Parasponia andersonii]|uniref:Uncharacterized protein n=1 Tax=Parasponia andersonii TaxID=3476 RepID=A0A2P5CVJ0_PARAD|nr:hypothetical protein PanWU01x14_120000 [Parasponia andersonii]